MAAPEHNQAIQRRAFLARGMGAAYGAALAASVHARAASQSRAPSQGKADIQILDLDWVDPQRSRPVPCRAYLPSATTPAQGIPLVVFSHGLGGSRTGYRYLGSYLAEHGVASIHPQHVGSDRQLWSSGNPFALLERLNGASSDGEALARVADVRFVLDQVLALSQRQRAAHKAPGEKVAGGAWGADTLAGDAALFARIDAQALVVAGHSYGANTAMLLAGALVERHGKPVSVRDERLRAALLLSAPPFYGESSPGRILASVRIPTLHITATEDLIRIPGLRSGLEDRLAVFDATASRFKCLAVFEGGSHSVFTDRFGLGDPEANLRIKQATRELCLAFLQVLGSSLPGFVPPLRNDTVSPEPHPASGSGADDLARWEMRHAPLLHRFVRSI